MTLTAAVFYAVGAVAVLSGMGVVFSRNVVHAALFLVLALLAVAGVYILLTVEFLALVQIFLYGGAVTILVLFALMLTRARDLPAALNGSQWPFALVAAAALLSLIGVVVVATSWSAADEPTTVAFQSIGDTLFRVWAVPFEVASLVLLVALVGAIILAQPEEGE